MAKNRKPPGKPWKPGQSGNPKGRPPGIPNKTERLRQMIDAEALVKSLHKAALGGDVGAARTLLERCLPPIKATAAAVALPALAAAVDLTAQARAVLDAVAVGALPADLGTALVQSIAAIGRIAEIDELTRRLAALETTYEAAV